MPEMRCCPAPEACPLRTALALQSLPACCLLASTLACLLACGPACGRVQGHLRVQVGVRLAVACLMYEARSAGSCVFACAVPGAHGRGPKGRREPEDASSTLVRSAGPQRQRAAQIPHDSIWCVSTNCTGTFGDGFWCGAASTECVSLCGANHRRPSPSGLIIDACQDAVTVHVRAGGARQYPAFILTLESPEVGAGTMTPPPLSYPPTGSTGSGR